MKYILLAAVIFIVLVSCEKRKEYKVKISFCDERSSITLITKTRFSPCEIETFREALPIFHQNLNDSRIKYINVCDCEVIYEIK